MNITNVKNYVSHPVYFTEFETELYAIICLCVVILTKGIVSSIMRCIRLEETHHHVHYSNEYSTSDLNFSLTPKPKPKPKTPTAPPNSPAGEKKSEFDSYESFRIPRPPPRDELV